MTLTPARKKEVLNMKKRAQDLSAMSSRLRAQAGALLDPPARRRAKKRAVVG